jgi:hypothetical protein
MWGRCAGLHRSALLAALVLLAAGALAQGHTRTVATPHAYPAIVTSFLNASAAHNNFVDTNALGVTSIQQSPYESTSRSLGFPLLIQIGNTDYQANTGAFCFEKFPAGQQTIYGLTPEVKPTIVDDIESDTGDDSDYDISGVTFTQTSPTEITFTVDSNHGYGGRIWLNADSSVQSVVGTHLGEIAYRDVISYPSTLKLPSKPTTLCDEDDALPVPSYVNAAFRATAATPALVATMIYAAPGKHYGYTFTKVMFSRRQHAYAYFARLIGLNEFFGVGYLQLGRRVYYWQQTLAGGCYVRTRVRSEPSALGTIDRVVDDAAAAAPAGLDYTRSNGDINWTVGAFLSPGSGSSGYLTLNPNRSIHSLRTPTGEYAPALTRIAYVSRLRFPKAPKNLCKK